jgi:hypothetical protein
VRAYPSPQVFDLGGKYAVQKFICIYIGAGVVIHFAVGIDVPAVHEVVPCITVKYPLRCKYCAGVPEDVVAIGAV